MKVATVAIAVALAALTGKSLAAPVAEFDLDDYDVESAELAERSFGKTFAVKAHAPGKPFNLEYLEASYSYFYLSGVSNTETCPDDADNCVESIHALIKQDPSKKTAYLDVLENHGEQMYVDKQGALRFATAGANSGTTNGFVHTGNSFSFEMNGSKKALMSCPVDIGMGSSYRVYVKTPGFKQHGCTAFTARAINAKMDNRAWGYPATVL